jgi:ATP synthase F1 delta subunit
MTKKIVTTYAKSLFQNLKNSKPAQEKRTIRSNTFLGKKKEIIFIPDVVILREELSLVRSAIQSSKKLTSYFQSPVIPEKRKLEILQAIFPGLSIPLVSFLKVLTERNHLTLLPEISEEFSRLLFEFKNYVKVKLITSTFLQKNYGKLLLESLKKLTQSKSILLSVSYNPKLLGGFILEYNSTILDLSLLKEFSLFFNEI